ncbi:hypothetical protein [Halochromatium roseum]|uniref:hypothetical protein n=1 Tax=Halochromatium roseum TaxID=391920 RepID=UPI003B835C1B
MAAVFYDPYAITIEDLDHDEERFVTIVGAAGHRRGRICAPSGAAAPTFTGRKQRQGGQDPVLNRLPAQVILPFA